VATGTPNETSVFEKRSISDIYEEIRDVYRRFPQPWVIGYSGGKDSTTVLQLTWLALTSLPESERQKPVYVIASDTKVETPVIVGYIDAMLGKINEQALIERMPFRAEKVMPTLNDSFWLNLIGRGYPAPTTRFRWCTDRMKINPANRFVENVVAKHGEVIMVLGVRKSESATRMQLMNTYEVNGHTLRRHSSLRGAYVYAPVADFSTEDIWSYLLQVPNPLGTNNDDLAALYRSASSGECPLVIDQSTPSCGSSRFGCWVCTVASKDSSMEGLVDNGEEWLQPLLEFRAYLAETIDPAHKLRYRDTKGRDGRERKKKDGTLAARTYKLDTSRIMLEKLLRTQLSIRQFGPDPEASLIASEELLEIRRIWRTERQDWEDSVPAIYRTVMGHDLDWPIDDDVVFGNEQKELLLGACREFDVPFELVARLLEVEKRSAGMARRAGVQDNIAAVFGQSWGCHEAVAPMTGAHGQFSLDGLNEAP